MVFLYVAIALLALWGFRFRKPADPSAALTINQSTMIKGIFVLLVFVSHVSQYLDLPGGFTTSSFSFIRSNLGQLVVVPFLFFSGYGVRYSILHKGEEYIRGIPKNRLIRTYLHVVVILLVFLALQLILGTRYTLRQVGMAFILLGDFGNSNWYLFAILCMYAVTWLSFRLVRNQKWACLLCFLFSGAYFVLLSRWKQRYWYDTVFVYSFGLIFPDLQLVFEKLIKRTMGWITSCVFLLAVLLVLTKLSFPRVVSGLMENVRAIIFMLLILVFLSRVQIGNTVLKWLGTNVFLCYTLQRLPMIILNHFDVSKTSIPLFVIGSALGTVLLVFLFDKLLNALDRLIFRT